MNTETKPDVEAIIELNDARHSPAKNGYFPHFAIKDNELNGGKIYFYDREYLEPNNSTIGTISFLNPTYLQGTLYTGKKINIQEGEHIVGYATITKIFNNILLKR